MNNRRRLEDIEERRRNILESTAAAKRITILTLVGMFLIGAATLYFTI